MTEKPILFSGEMVRAILAGVKTQTRRVIKPQPTSRGALVATPADQIWYTFPCDDGVERFARCPYGKIGDQLWVRETWQQIKDEPFYRATDGAWTDEPWRPSIYMPRELSRITLEVTSVHVERLQDISEDDALAEGCHGWEKPEDDAWMTARDVYEELWNKINSRRGFPWSSNPWVWVVSFRLAAPQQTLAAELLTARASSSIDEQSQPAEA